MRIPCPYCGSRDSAEFSIASDATLVRPADGAGDAMLDYVYLRDNPAGLHKEHWYHAAGCHAWLVVTRDTRTHEVVAAELATGDAS